MFTRIQLPLLLVVALCLGCISAFASNRTDLRDKADQTLISYENADQHLQLFTQQLQDVSSTIDHMQAGTESTLEQLTNINVVLEELAEEAERSRLDDAETKKSIDSALETSRKHTKETGDVLDTILSNILGKPVGQTFGKKATIKVFSLKEAGYRGYMAKVKLIDPKAVKLVLSGDKVGDKGETTSQAAKRTDATLAINAGGFAKDKNGLLFPMGITVIDGEIKTFYQTDLSFIGLNEKGHLVGGEVKTQQQVKDMGIMHGATFIPTLLKDGKKLTIPSKYRNKKEPRTLIGHFSNGDLLLIVIDGRSKQSSGVTLEEAQDKLLEFNVVDAYNLDGGGSSTFVYKGKVLNTPSDGKERKVVSNFVVNP